MSKVERVRLKSEPSDGGSYFASSKTSLEFVSSGCTMFDLALGGGWVEGRILNIVGDRSTGKTLLGIEASANFIQKYPRGFVRYREAESAFDKEYALALGVPVDKINFSEPDQVTTIEDFYEDLADCLIEGDEAKQPTLYILDSLDALSSRAELKRSMDEGTYGQEKAKKLSETFRRLVRDIAETRTTLIIISQVRDKIGVVFGKKYSRTGGRALDFYASQVAYLASTGTRRPTVQGVKRPASLKVLARMEKNKVGLPFRSAEFEILFGFGIDDLRASVDFLLECGAAKELLGVTSKSKESFLKSIWKLSDEKFQIEVRKINEMATEQWYKIEESFLPKRRKY